MSKRKILVQLDSDRHPSVFDRVVAVDAGAEEIFSYGSVANDDVEGLVHGAIFTRGPGDLKHTAIFVGGNNVARGEELLTAVKKAYFGPFRCSVMLDSNGSNTTAAAAVLAARRHLALENVTALVLGGTGPVGQRVALLLASQGAQVLLGSRNKGRAEDACAAIKERYPKSRIVAVDQGNGVTTSEPIHLVVAAGAAGIRLLPESALAQCKELRVAVDLNAVPPSGIEGIDVTDKGKMVGELACYGAIGVGGLKMKIHRAAVARLFTANDQVLDAEEIFRIGLELEGS